MVQQSVTGTGAYDGTQYGRAKGRFPLSGEATINQVVRVSARLLGTQPNAYTLQFYDAGVGTPVTATHATANGSAITVTLRRKSTGSVEAVASEVALAINQARLGIAASYEGDGNGVVTPMAATPIGNLQLGVDPDLRGPNADQYIWALPLNASAGFFYFEQDAPLLVHQFEALFSDLPSGLSSVTISRVNLDSNLEPIAGESVPIFVWENLSTARPDIAFSDVGIILHPFQALTVAAPETVPGLVRFDVRRTAGYPYP